MWLLVYYTETVSVYRAAPVTKSDQCFQPRFIRTSSELLCPFQSGQVWQLARLRMKYSTQAWSRCRNWMLLD